MHKPTPPTAITITRRSTTGQQNCVNNKEAEARPLGGSARGKGRETSPT
jgi:hypothetical protein